MSDESVTILLVEDNPGDQRLVREMLDASGYGGFRLLIADHLAAAAAMLDSEPVDIVLLDLRLPDGNGLDSLVKMHALSPGVPIVVFSQVEDESLAVKAVRMGAQDFLVKAHINGPLLTRSLRYAMERRQLEEHLHYLAHHDALTGLPNRKLFYDRLTRSLALSRRHQRPMALMLVDLNDFKRINDAHGHHVGDEILKQLADRLQCCLRTTDCVARLGGDEFILFATDLSDAHHATRVARKIIEVLAPPCLIGQRDFVMRASVGIALYPDDGDDMETLVKNADTAMYLAKGQGREESHFRFYSRDLDAGASERIELENALRRALEREEFVVNYQPQVDLHSSRVIGVEALLRWDRDGELLMPARFMAALEESGLIVPVGGWVLAEACRQAAAWRAAGLPLGKIAVNISPRQFRDEHLVERVARVLCDSGLDARLLELELSEESLCEDEEMAIDKLRRLNALGVHLALDNYRARSASLRDLKRFPIHTVKLDRTIVRDMISSAADAAIVQAVISVAHVFKMKGVAEGVETTDQADMLRRQTCDDAQGFVFSRPLSAEALAALLQGAAPPLLPQ
ncbi:MAG: EAL domain-containing protein [Candidatus Nitricoxidivorans perseverans]|uniref:EAL domain-containing protein n=1 Tax=Candidatus Nitricoxidivorans perseverans TaxID=2975601 RepID=A0AA49FMD7_9PROT|nr:MAG: EAL domain-containing protein [Candidatus Nitricoxidivorans perseverans]